MRLMTAGFSTGIFDIFILLFLGLFDYILIYNLGLSTNGTAIFQQLRAGYIANPAPVPNTLTLPPRQNY